MVVNLSALAGAGQQFFDNNGNPLSGGKLWSYQAGTTTPQTTYTIASGSVAHTNPIVLDSAGRVATGQIWLTAGENYKFSLFTSADVLIAIWDNITGINGTGITSNAINVVYDPAGTSAVPTTVQAKLRESVSVLDFGGTLPLMAQILGVVGADDNTSISLSGYHAVNDGGGGVFFWSPSADKADHNGGTVIDPSHTGVVGDSTWWTAVNVGSGCWVRQCEPGFRHLKWFGAKADGVQDDAYALRAAVASFDVVIGGDLKLCAGTILLDSSGTSYAMIPLYPNVNIKGEGWGTIVYVGDGALGSRNVFSLDNVSAIFTSYGSVSFEDFQIDLNGDNNLRLISDPARNNAAINVAKFRRCKIKNVRAQNAPGNQVFWVRTPEVGFTDSVAIVQNCYIYRVATDIAGNTNGDHSSSYIGADYIYQIDNVFEKTVAGTTTETSMEAHGRYVSVHGNRVINYYRGLHVVPDIGDMKHCDIFDNYFGLRLHSIMLWTVSGSNIDVVNIYGNTFEVIGANGMAAIDAAAHVTVGHVKVLNISNNSWTGMNRTTGAAIIAGSLVDNLYAIGNDFTELGGAAVETSNSKSLIVQGNNFYNCANGSGADNIIRVLGALESFTCSGNTFTQTLYYAENAISIQNIVQRGRITDNNFNYFFDDYPFEVTGSGISSVCLYIEMELYLAGAVILPDAENYATKGSYLLNLNGDVRYLRDTAGFGNSWV
jgi:hypothetical protein